MPEIPASHRDLLDGQFATLATIGPDGRPQLSEVWFLAEDDTIGLSLNTSRQKTKNLLANPAANLFLLDLAVPYRYLEIRGDARSHQMMTIPLPTGSARNTARICGPRTGLASRVSRSSFAPCGSTRST